MKTIAILLVTGVLASCAVAPTGSQPRDFFNDQLFVQPSEQINVGDVFAISSEMKRYLSTEIADQLRIKGLQQGLVDALYNQQQLKIRYDSTKTRNASETFHDRVGNCLSLSIMTAALAQELGMPVRFKSLVVDETWARNGNLYFSVGHINLTLGSKSTNILRKFDGSAQITIDFIPPGEVRGEHAHDLAKETVIAMYMNNRAAEALARGNVNDAYWWSREAITQAPEFLNPYNTLGVVYRRHGNLLEAERVLTFALRQEPENMRVMSNLAVVLNDLGRTADAQLLAARIEKRQPHPPYHFFDLGQAAMLAKDYSAASAFFEEELRRDEYNHEFHFWLAAAYSELGNLKLSHKHLAKAMEFSTTVKAREMYAAKFDRLKAYK